MSNINYKSLEKRYKMKTGPERFNFFIEPNNELNSNFKFTDKKFAKTTRPIERSLRTIVKANSERINSVLTAEEESLQTLARGQ